MVWNHRVVVAYLALAIITIALIAQGKWEQLYYFWTMIAFGVFISMVI